jgi:phage protein D
MADNTGLPQVLIKIDGASAPTDFMADVAEIVVDTTLAAPDMVMVRVWDDPTTLRWINDATFDLGKSIAVSVGGKALITAEITSLEPLIDASNGASYIVRGYDRANRLRLGKKSRTFLNKSDSDLASQLASDAGMSAQVDSTSVVYPFLLQYNQTDMEFLAERAARIGYQVSADDKTLLFKNAATEVSSTEVAELAYAVDLQQFRPRISVARQVAKATVTGWDPKEKQPIAGEASSAAQWSQIGYGKQGTAAALVSSAAAAVVDAPVISKAEADAIAKAMLSDMTAEFIEAEGVCAGNPAIKAGKVIKIKGVGTRFSGKYFVTASTHTFTPEGGYLTHFRVTGRQPDTVSHLVGANGDAHRSRIYGVVIGVVTNLRDPDNLGRIKVKYPWLNQEVESDWLRVATLSAGNGMGIMFLPEVNDEVLDRVRARRPDAALHAWRVMEWQGRTAAAKQRRRTEWQGRETRDPLAHRPSNHPGRLGQHAVDHDHRQERQEQSGDRRPEQQDRSHRRSRCQHHRQRQYEIRIDRRHQHRIQRQLLAQIERQPVDERHRQRHLRGHRPTGRQGVVVAESGVAGQSRAKEQRHGLGE